MSNCDPILIDLTDDLDSIEGWALAFAALANSPNRIEPRVIDVMSNALFMAVTSAKDRIDKFALDKSAS